MVLPEQESLSTYLTNLQIQVLCIPIKPFTLETTNVR